MVCFPFPVQLLVQRNLLCLRKLLAAAAFSETEVATIIGTPLTERAVRAGMLFGKRRLFHDVSVGHVTLNRIALQQLHKGLALVGLYQQVTW